MEPHMFSGFLLCRPLTAYPSLPHFSPSAASGSAVALLAPSLSHAHWRLFLLFPSPSSVVCSVMAPSLCALAFCPPHLLRRCVNRHHPVPSSASPDVSSAPSIEDLSSPVVDVPLAPLSSPKVPSVSSLHPCYTPYSPMSSPSAFS